jgi:hypothetical protein
MNALANFSKVNAAEAIQAALRWWDSSPQLQQVGALAILGTLAWIAFRKRPQP